MLNAMTTSAQIQDRLEAVIRRNNEGIAAFRKLPPNIQKQLDGQASEDIAFLVTYIKALHAMLEDLSQDQAESSTLASSTEEDATSTPLA